MKSLLDTLDALWPLVALEISLGNVVNDVLKLAGNLFVLVGPHVHAGENVSFDKLLVLLTYFRAELLRSIVALVLFILLISWHLPRLVNYLLQI